MKKWVTILVLGFGVFYQGSAGIAAEKKELVFGAIALSKASEVKDSLTPLLQYLEKEIGAAIKFETGKDYPDTISKFQSGYFDFGYIGPSPYVIATSGEKDPGIFRIIAGLETNGKPYYHAVIIAAKDNAAINTIADLRGKRFAFGSRQSTLSCYMPAKMLMDAGVFETLAEYKFLGKHDKVARDVSMGAFEGGGIIESVANASSDRVKIIARSEPVYDFLLVAHHSMDPVQFQKIKDACLKMKDPDVLNAITKGVTGLIETRDGNYDSLRQVMKQVDAVIPQ